MPYSYTLMPDGNTMEPDFDQQPEQEETPPLQLPWLIPQPKPEPEPTPEVTSVTPMITLVSPIPLQQPQPESTSESTQSSQTFRLGERILRRNRERARQDAATQSKAPSLQVIDEVPDFADLGFIDSEPLPVSEAPDWPGSTPLSQGQSLHVDHLLSTETDTLAREVLIGIRREGIPPEALLYDFMSQYAEWGWDDLSSAWAVQVLNMIRQSDWDEVFAHADSTPVETIAQDLGNNTREGLVIMDAGSGNVVLNKTGVRGPGGQQYVGLQDYEVEALRGLDLIFVHNHTNDTGASKDDLLSAFDAGAKLLIVITPQGQEFVYIRGRYGMVEVRDAKASYKVGPATLDETIALANKSAEQAAAYRDDPPEYVFRQEELRSIGIEVSGILRVYKQETFVRGVDSPHMTYEISDTPGQFRYLRTSDSGNGAFLIEIDNEDYWIDTLDPDAEFAIVPFVEHENYPAQTSGQIIATGAPDPTATPIGYVLQSFVVDRKVDIELTIYSTWEDRTGGKGLLSRDFNPLGTMKEFELQSPVIGPDVRVELVSRVGRDDKGLGNYVVISFPASVYEGNEDIMQRLAKDPKHNPNEWREGGRIFIGFAHLSVIDEDIQPGANLNTAAKAMIGWTGNTAQGKNFVTHLDLSLAYFGPTRWNKTGFAEAEAYMARNRSEVNNYMVFPIRSNLNSGPVSHSVYGENLDPIWVWPALDELGQAKNERGERINVKE